MADNPFSAEPPEGTVLRITMPSNWLRTVYIIHRSGSDSPYTLTINLPGEPKPRAYWFTAGSDIWDYWPQVVELISRAVLVEIASWETA